MSKNVLQLGVNTSIKAYVFFMFILCIKVAMLVVFSSGYRTDLFVPFIQDFIAGEGAPWDGSRSVDSFPYPPLMLYVLSFFMYPVEWFGGGMVSEGFFYGLPLIISDLLITFLLLIQFPWNKTEIFIFYFASPIIIFSTYMHGQLDIIPTSLVFSSIFLLVRKRFWASAILIGFAVCTKLHTIVVLPLLLIYLVNKGRYREASYFIFIPVGLFIFFALPYIGSAGFSSSVLNNEKQQLIFDSFISLGSVKIYLPVLLVFAIYLRFSVYRKVNSDLLYAAIGGLFSVFLLCITPSPAWFVWVVPFFTLFYIRYSDSYLYYIYYASMSVFYLLYFLLFHEYDYPQLMFVGDVLLKNSFTGYEELGNVLFTIMEVILLGTIFLFYKKGIRSNEVYTMERAFVVGIGGDSGAGKSTLITYLRNMFNDQMLELEGDGDHKWERGHENWQEYTHLDPKANLLHRQAEQVALLKNRKTIKRSDYDHNTGRFTEADKIKPRDFIVLAGLHPFYLPKMRKVIDLKIYLDLDERLRASWKIQRDQKHRGYTVVQILESLAKREGDSGRYIRPQKKFSDFTIRLFPTDEEMFSEHIYKGDLGLEVAVNASIPLDNVIHAFQDNGYKLTWDYSPDLNTQYIRFEEEPIDLDTKFYVNHYVMNSSELVSNSNWEKGYAGVIQFLVLFAISEMMQERAQREI